MILIPQFLMLHMIEWLMHDPSKGIAGLRAKIQSVRISGPLANIEKPFQIGGAPELPRLKRGIL